ncbi:DUF3099 domain-containing protein [Microlunatus soli]|uniref:DUF3099 domain-containing protein n=1 Tax=Microlunatus soli TaxID=630515 RepID=A0A1H1P1G0_9ACTN|nr:DUF3099 domain-containing protein [Microlunatus soli]SDS05023.1 Protein of unknown function [Microlunatus soli]
MSAAHGSRTGRRGDNPSLITSAQPGASEDFRGRQIRYVVTMGFRVACFIAMIWVPNPWRWLLFAAAVVLPAIAVMFANQADQRSDRGTFETGSGPRFSITGSSLGELDPRNGSADSPDADASDPGSTDPNSTASGPGSPGPGESDTGPQQEGRRG